MFPQVGVAPSGVGRRSAPRDTARQAFASALPPVRVWFAMPSGVVRVMPGVAQVGRSAVRLAFRFIALLSDAAVWAEDVAL